MGTLCRSTGRGTRDRVPRRTANARRPRGHPARPEKPDRQRRQRLPRRRDRRGTDRGQAGPGIPIADRERVFEPFHRGSTPAGRRAGYGLGLALVRAAALQHGGTVQIADRDGRGTRITLALRSSRSS
ncbi:MAG: ATP-binding protein [Planctomycetota bacterium]